jgi:hypothetical protein
MKKRRFTMKKHFLFLGIVIFATELSFALFNSLTKAQANSSVLSANNNIALQKVEIHQNDIQAELCIFLPSLEQWGPYATLIVDGKVISNSEVALINAKDPNTAKSQTRCYQFTFPVTVTEKMSKTAVLKLEKLTADYQGGLLTETGLVAIKKRLQETQPQIDFTVVIEKGKGGGGAYIQILAKPDGMSDDQVFQLIQQASVEEVSENWQEVVDLH